jgi:hypothetical protein
MMFKLQLHLFVSLCTELHQNCRAMTHCDVLLLLLLLSAYLLLTNGEPQARKKYIIHVYTQRIFTDPDFINSEFAIIRTTASFFFSLYETNFQILQFRLSTIWTRVRSQLILITKV